MNFRLRALEPVDLPQLNRWRNDPALIETLGANFHYIPEQVDAEWYDHYLKNRQQAHRLSILVDEEYIGNVNLTGIHPVNRSAEFSIMIGNPAFRGKGIGRQATIHMLQYGFFNLNLNRIWLTVMAENKPAIALYEQCGFQHEGIKRQDVFKSGRFHDMVMMAMLRPAATPDQTVR